MVRGALQEGLTPLQRRIKYCFLIFCASEFGLIRGMAFGEKSLIRGIASLNEQFNNILLFVLLKSSLIRGVTFGERVII